MPAAGAAGPRGGRGGAETGGFGSRGPSGGGPSRGDLDLGLSADIGGGLGATISSRTGRVTGFTGARGKADPAGAERAAGLADRAAASGRSLFGQKLVDKFTSPTAIGALGGALVGTLVGVGPLAGAKIGAQVGGSGLFSSEAEKGEGFDSFGSTQTAQTAAPQLGQTQQLGGQALAGISPGGGAGVDSRGQPAQQLAAAGRTSGLAQAAPQQPQNQFLNRLGPLPTVNLQAFPGALGRV